MQTVLDQRQTETIADRVGVGAWAVGPNGPFGLHERHVHCFVVIAEIDPTACATEPFHSEANAGTDLNARDKECHSKRRQVHTESLCSHLPFGSKAHHDRPTLGVIPAEYEQYHPASVTLVVALWQ